MELQVNQVIEELSQIDTITERILLSADNEKEEYTILNESRKKEYENFLMENMKQNLESYKTRIQADNNRILKQYQTETETRLSNLDSAYEQNHTKWAAELLNKLTAE